MKLSGDVSAEDRELATQLILLETKVDADKSYANEHKARIYTCLAHDWYQLAAEEEGNRLLLKAEKVCPGYFKGPVIEHQKEDADYDFLVKNLTHTLILLLISNVNDGL